MAPCFPHATGGGPANEQRAGFFQTWWIADTYFASPHIQLQWHKTTSPLISWSIPAAISTRSAGYDPYASFMFRIIYKREPYFALAYHTTYKGIQSDWPVIVALVQELLKVHANPTSADWLKFFMNKYLATIPTSDLTKLTNKARELYQIHDAVALQEARKKIFEIPPNDDDKVTPVLKIAINSCDDTMFVRTVTEDEHIFTLLGAMDDEASLRGVLRFVTDRIRDLFPPPEAVQPAESPPPLPSSGPPPPPPSSGPPPPPPSSGPPPPPSNGPPPVFNLEGPFGPKLSATPERSLRQFHWTGLPNIQGTIFFEMELEGTLQNLPLKDLQEKFEWKQQESKPQGLAASSLQPADGLQGVDRNKIIAASGFVKNFNSYVDDVGSAVELLDCTFFKEIEASNILKWVPTPDEVVLLVSAKETEANPISKKVIQLMLSLGAIDRVTQKINAIVFATEKFETLFADAERDINAVIIASKAVVMSANLKEIFNIILALGNYINPPRKRAFGFKLSALNNIASYKNANGKSLLAFLVEHLISTKSPLLDFPNDIRDVETAKNASRKDIEHRMRQLHEGLNLLTQELEPSHNAEMQKYRDDIASRIATLEDSFKKMPEDFKAAYQFFGEGPAEPLYADFFSYFSEFSLKVQTIKLGSKPAERSSPERSVGMEVLECLIVKPK